MGENQFKALGIQTEEKNLRNVTRIDSLEKIKEISCGDCHSVAIDESGDLYTWGCNLLGACGFDKTQFEFIDIPKKLEIRDEETKSKVNFKNASCGDAFTIVLSNQGGIYSFGYDGFGQLANGSEDSYSLPKRVLFEEKNLKFDKISNFFFSFPTNLFSLLSFQVVDVLIPLPSMIKRRFIFGVSCPLWNVSVFQRKLMWRINLKRFVVVAIIICILVRKIYIFLDLLIMV